MCAAEDVLSYSFHHCHRSSQKNKRMILIYLLPVKMLLVRNSDWLQNDTEIRFKPACCCFSQGHMPTHQLLRKYDLLQFADVTKGVR